MFTLLTSIALAAIVSQPSVAPAPADPTPQRDIRSARVRAADTRTATLLMLGIERSATIRTLVNHIERQDVIVYLEMQPQLRKRLAGTLTWITATRDHRYVRVSINPELSTDAAIATLGHELQHVFEVANAPSIVCERTLAKFYQEHRGSNQVHSSGWDTEAARVAGEDVRRDLMAFASQRHDRERTGRAADSIQQLDPDDWMVVYRRARGMLPP
jgi:hypothetical protein